MSLVSNTLKFHLITEELHPNVLPNVLLYSQNISYLIALIIFLISVWDFFFFFFEISPKYLIIESRQMSSLSRCIYNWAHTVPGQVPLRSCEISVSCESSGLTLAIGQGSHVLVSHTALCVTLTEKVKDS